MPSSASVHPPKSTLFPYTTLFRSRPPPPRAEREARPPPARRVTPPRATKASSSVAGEMPARCPIAMRWPVRQTPARATWARPPSFQDRKSTRLNSSHVEISYAVFCFRSPPEIYTLSLHDALPISATSTTGGEGGSASTSAAGDSSSGNEGLLVGSGGNAGTVSDRDAMASQADTGTSDMGTTAELPRSEEHTSELQSRRDLVCRLLLPFTPRNLHSFPTRRSSDLGHLHHGRRGRLGLHQRGG